LKEVYLSLGSSARAWVSLRFDYEIPVVLPRFNVGAVALGSFVTSYFIAVLGEILENRFHDNELIHYHWNAISLRDAIVAALVETP
jgi:hypothetical protein